MLVLGVVGLATAAPAMPSAGAAAVGVAAAGAAAVVADMATMDITDIVVGMAVAMAGDVAKLIIKKTASAVFFLAYKTSFTLAPISTGVGATVI